MYSIKHLSFLSQKTREKNLYLRREGYIFWFNLSFLYFFVSKLSEVFRKLADERIGTYVQASREEMASRYGHYHEYKD